MILSTFDLTWICHQYILRASRKSLVPGSLFGESYLGSTSADESGKDLAAAVLPLGQLLGGDGVGVPAGVQTLHQGRGLGGTTADVEGPADKGTILVGVENDLGLSVEGDTVLGRL